MSRDRCSIQGLFMCCRLTCSPQDDVVALHLPPCVLGANESRPRCTCHEAPLREATFAHGYLSLDGIWGLWSPNWVGDLQRATSRFVSALGDRCSHLQMATKASVSIHQWFPFCASRLLFHLLSCDTTTWPSQCDLRDLRTAPDQEEDSITKLRKQQFESKTRYRIMDVSVCIRAGINGCMYGNGSVSANALAYAFVWLCVSGSVLY